MPYLELPGGAVIRTNSPQYYPSGKRLSAVEGKRKRRAYAIGELHKLIRPGDIVRTILRHVSRSGMSRRIDCYVMVEGQPRFISTYVADAIGLRLGDPGIVVRDFGMDMGFHIVCALSRAMFPNGFDCIGERCPSNDHSNGDGDRGRTPHRHSDGGYALRHAWL